MPDLFSPLTIRSVTFRNRIAVSPMCEYSSEDGFANDWHLVHLGSRAVGGAGLVITEAAAVEPRGRISPTDLGIYRDAHIEMLTRITRFIRDQGAVPGIQLAHAGRKASTRVPWEGGAVVPESEGGWQTVAPSPIPFRPGEPAPAELTKSEIGGIVEAFAGAARRWIPGCRDPRRARLLDRRVSLALVEPPRRRVWRRIRRPHPLCAGSRHCGPHRVAGFPAPLHAHLGYRLGGGRLADRRFREVGAAPSAARRRLDRLLVRRSRAACQDPHRTGLPDALRRAHPARVRHPHGSGGDDHRGASGRRNRSRRAGGHRAAGARVSARPILAAARREGAGRTRRHPQTICPRVCMRPVPGLWPL